MKSYLVETACNRYTSQGLQTRRKLLFSVTLRAVGSSSAGTFPRQ
jgi:hypothetical protein